MKSKFLFFLFIFWNVILLSQTNSGVRYQLFSQQNSNVVINNNIDLSGISNEIASFRNMIDKKNKVDGKIETLKNTFSAIKHFPDRIIDGWHLVKVTNNYNICSDAKVLIQNNEIKKFVVGNWIKNSLTFVTISSIKDAKAVIEVGFDDKPETLELYFIYDLEKQNLVEKPFESAYICFWSDLKKAEHIKVWLNKRLLGTLKGVIVSQANCYDPLTITLEVKPGIYDFTAAGKGSIAWEGSINAKENECLSLLLNKENQKK